ncbi:MAG: DUF349 domain-containing protein [Gammaproteobacteria bacterium]|nr:DUF349 domain-containing protein [Gammaproteobacteria bacterium]
MISSIFKSDWQHQSVDKRLQAIEKMVASDQPVLTELAQQDPEQSVRLAALDKLTDPRVLIEISQAHADAATREHAELALSVLLGPKSKLSEEEFRSLVSTNPATVTLVTKHCPHVKLRSELVSALSAADQSELIASIDYTETRQLIAENLESEEHLQRARNLLRGKDKNTEKIIKSKLDLLHARQRQDKENQDAAEKICQKMEFLATHDWRAEFVGKYSVWQQRWDSLDFAPTDQVRQRYQKAQSEVGARVEQELLHFSVAESQQKLTQEMEDYCRHLAGLSRQQLIPEKTVIIEKLEQSINKWQALKESVAPDPLLAEKFLMAENCLISMPEFCQSIDIDREPGGTTGDALKSISRSIKSSIAALKWPDHYPALTAVAEVLDELQQLKLQSKLSLEKAAGELKKLHQRINRLLSTTSRGDLGRAKRELAAVGKLVNNYTGKDKSALNERLDKATAAVSKMVDWNNFATEPKLIELCEAMEAMIESKSHPDKIAADIAGLQQRWKVLGHADCAEQHWQRFKAAADQAYLPCAAHFKQRRDIQRQNLKKREPLVSQMRELLEKTDWQGTPDYKKIESGLQSISNEWQKIKDVERKAGRKQWERISKIRAGVYEKLDVVYDANIEAKNQLIERAELMLESDLTEDSLNKLQFLQNSWKQIGVTRRKQDQLAWKKFKKLTDSVYQKIQQLRKSKRAEENAQLNPHRQIIRKIKSLAKSATELAEADSAFTSLETDYQALPALPSNVAEKITAGLKSDYRRACDAYSTARDRLRKAGRARMANALQKKAGLCAELEQLGANASPQSIEKLQHAIAEIEIPDKELSRRFNQRVEVALDSDRSAAARARQLVCIDLEILLGVESPAQDAALRMQVQLERMKKDGIGHAQIETGAAIRKIKQDWLCLPGAEAELQQALDQRFSRLIGNKS